MSTSPAYVTFVELALGCALEVSYAVLKRRRDGLVYRRWNVLESEFGKSLIATAQLAREL